MNLKNVWKKYEVREPLNYSDVKELIKEHGCPMVFEAGSTIIEKGDFPNAIYFIIKGLAVGQRSFEDGNEYNYFRVDKTNGNIGLLEILSRKEMYVASIRCISEVHLVRVDSAIIYKLLMNNLTLLRKSSFLLATDLYQSSKKEGINYYYQGIDRLRLFFIDYFNQKSFETKQNQYQVETTYADIASQIGMSTRTVGRAIQKLKVNNEINVIKKKIYFDNQQVERMQEEIKK